MAIQQAIQQSQSQEGASAAAGGAGDFQRKRPGVDISGAPAKRQRPGSEGYTPFPGTSRQKNRDEQFEGDEDEYVEEEEDFSSQEDNVQRGRGKDSRKNNQSRLDALRQTTEDESKPAKKGPSARRDAGSDMEDNDFVDDGGGTPCFDENPDPSAGPSGIVAEVMTPKPPPKPIRYEPNQVHVSGFSLETNQEELVGAMKSEFGEVSHCKMHRKADKTKVTRFAVIEFQDEDMVKRILGAKTTLTQQVGRYRLTIARIPSESQDSPESGSSGTKEEAAQPEKKEVSEETQNEQMLVVKVVQSIIEKVHKTTFPEMGESEDESLMKNLTKIQLAVVKDLQKSQRHPTPTRMAHIVKLIRGIESDVRVAQTLWIWDRSVLVRQILNGPKDAGLLPVVQRLESQVQKALKGSGSYNAYNLLRKIGGIISIVAGKLERGEDKDFNPHDKFRSKPSQMDRPHMNQRGSFGHNHGNIREPKLSEKFLKGEVDHPEDVPRDLDLHKGPSAPQEFDSVLGVDADAEFKGTETPQGLQGELIFTSKKIGERKLILNEPLDLVKSARKILMKKMEEDNRELSRPLTMLVKHTIRMCVHKIITVLYYRHRKVISKFQQEELKTQLICEELKKAGITPPEKAVAEKTPVQKTPSQKTPARSVLVSGIRYDRKKDASDTAIVTAGQEPSATEGEASDQPEITSISGPKNIVLLDEFSEEVQMAVAKWKKDIKYSQLHTKEQYTSVKRLKMELSAANRQIINKKMNKINQEQYSREDSVDLRLGHIFDIKLKVDGKKRQKYEEKQKKAKREEKKKKKKEKEREVEPEKRKPKKSVLAFSSTSSGESDSDLDLPKIKPKALQQTPQKESVVDLVSDRKSDSETKNKTPPRAAQPKEAVKKHETSMQEPKKEQRKIEKKEINAESKVEENKGETKPAETDKQKSKSANKPKSADNIFQKFSKEGVTLEPEETNKKYQENVAEAEKEPEKPTEVTLEDINAAAKSSPKAEKKRARSSSASSSGSSVRSKSGGGSRPGSRAKSGSRASSRSGSRASVRSRGRSRSRSGSKASVRSKSRSISGSGGSIRSGSRSRSGSRASVRSRSRSRSGSRVRSRSGSRSSGHSDSRSRSGSRASVHSGSRSRSGSRGSVRSGSRSPSGSRGSARSGSRGSVRSGSRGSVRSGSRGSARSGSRGSARSGSRGSVRSGSRSGSESRANSRASSKGKSRSRSRSKSRSVSPVSKKEEKTPAQEESSKSDTKDTRVTSSGGEINTDSEVDSEKILKVSRDVEILNKELEGAANVDDVKTSDDVSAEKKSKEKDNYAKPPVPKASRSRVYSSSGSDEEDSTATKKKAKKDPDTLDTEMEEVVNQIANLREKIVSKDDGEEPMDVQQSKANKKRKAAIPEPTLEDDNRDAPPGPDESMDTTEASVVDDDSSDSDSDDASISPPPERGVPGKDFIVLTKDEASKAFYDKLTSEQRRCVYMELEHCVRYQKKVVRKPFGHDDKSLIKSELIGKYLKQQRENPRSKGEVLTNEEKKALKKLCKDERKRHKKKKNKKDKHDKKKSSDKH